MNISEGIKQLQEIIEEIISEMSYEEIEKIKEKHKIKGKN